MVARVGGELVPNSGPALIVDQGGLLTEALYAHARHIFFTLSKRRGLPALIVDQGRLLTGALYAHAFHAPLDRLAFSLSRCPKIRDRRIQQIVDLLAA